MQHRPSRIFVAAAFGLAPGSLVPALAASASASASTAASTVSGSIVAVNVPAHRLVVLRGTQRVTVMTTTRTRITLDGTTSKLAALHAGLTVSVRSRLEVRYRVAVAVTARTPSTAVTSTTTASPSLSSALEAVLAEERNARATYANVVAVLGDRPPFANVVASEDQHIATITGLMVAHGVTVPASSATGTAAPTSRTASCQLGVTTETAVIAAYEKGLPLVRAYPDVVRAFQNLLDASQSNHLPAFLHCS